MIDRKTVQVGLNTLSILLKVPQIYRSAESVLITKTELYKFLKCMKQIF